MGAWHGEGVAAVAHDDDGRRDGADRTYPVSTDRIVHRAEPKPCAMLVDGRRRHPNTITSAMYLYLFLRTRPGPPAPFPPPSEGVSWKTDSSAVRALIVRFKRYIYVVY